MNAAKPPSPDEVRVLIVDDEGRLRDVLTRAIASWGFQVASAALGGRSPAPDARIEIRYFNRGSESPRNHRDRTIREAPRDPFGTFR